MNMLQVAPKLTEKEWELIQHSLIWTGKVQKVPVHELLLWKKELILEAVHTWANWGGSLRYMDNEIELLKKLGWDGVRRDVQKPARPRA